MSICRNRWARREKLILRHRAILKFGRALAAAPMHLRVRGNSSSARADKEQRLPPDHPLLPNEHTIAQFEEQGHDCGKKCCHDDQCGVDLSIFGPALCPTDIPAKS